MLTFLSSGDILAAVKQHLFYNTMRIALSKQAKQSKKPDRRSG
jgi:hypothetical protein